MTTLTEFMTSELNAQMNREFLNERVYLMLSAYFQSQSLDGFACFMRNKAHVEYEHAMKFYDFSISRFGTVQMNSLEAITGTLKTATAAFEAAFKMMEQTTQEIWDLFRKSQGEGDYATCEFLRCLIDAQVEEERCISYWLTLVKLAGTNAAALLEVNQLIKNQPFMSVSLGDMPNASY